MDRLIAELERKANERAEEILAAARHEAAEIRAAAEREVERIERVRLAECAAMWKERAARRTAEVRGKSARVRLRARSRFLDRVFERAASRVSEGELPDGYRETLAAWVERAFDYLGDARAEVTCPPAHEATIREALPDPSVDLRVDPEAPAGFLARADDGTVEVDGTLRGALARRRDALEIAVLERFENGRE
ncbi:MAG: V-type ATP synthase subunit E family protein [Gemmatimonadota bacterium]|nr:V-type ATP synthase subunit E family protein [Gemmatimonadota bacterium]